MVPLLIVAAVAGVAVVAAAVTAAIRWRRRRALVARYGAAAVGHRKPFRFRERLPVILMLAGFACAAIAFAQTRIERQTTQGTVILTMDVSKSMERTDVEPSRSVAAQEAAEAFLERLPGDFQVGVVTFADRATLAVAPTHDREEAAAAFGSTASSEGTVIGDGMTASLDAIERTWAEGGRGPAAIVLLSDGQDTGSEVSPHDAAARATSIGVPVFTVTLGDITAGGADDDLMRAVADGTGGSTFTAVTADQLTHVYQDLGSTLSSDLHVGSSAWIFVVLGGAFALAAVVTLFLPSTPSEFHVEPRRRSGRSAARSRS